MKSIREWLRLKRPAATQSNWDEEFMSPQGKAYLKKDDLVEHPIWAFNEIDELVYPVLNESDFPQSQINLYIKVKFITPGNLPFDGYILGIKNIFSIAIFYSDKIFYFNKNLYEECLEELQELGQALNKTMTISDFSPLYYKTDIHLPGYNNIEGEFDLLKPLTNEERLDF